MRNITPLLVAGALLTGGVANAQQYTLINTLGTQSGTTDAFIASSGSAGSLLGTDATALPNPSQSGYAVLPFTLGSSLAGGATSAAVTQISTAIVVDTPTTGATTPSNNLYGAIFSGTVGAGGSINANSSHQVGSWFQFDLVTNGAESANLNTGVIQGTGVKTDVTASGLAADGVNLQAGQSYYLVLAPKAGLNASSSDSLLDYASLIALNSTKLAAVAGSSQTYATEGAGLSENALTGGTAGANPGDVLVNTKSGTANGYFGVNIQAQSLAAPIPEASSLASLLLGIVPGGIFLARRRKAEKAGK